MDVVAPGQRLCCVMDLTRGMARPQSVLQQVCMGALLQESTECKGSADGWRRIDKLQKDTGPNLVKETIASRKTSLHCQSSSLLRTRPLISAMWLNTFCHRVASHIVICCGLLYQPEYTFISGQVIRLLASKFTV